jgi:hypothetical protein
MWLTLVFAAAVAIGVAVVSRVYGRSYPENTRRLNAIALPWLRDLSAFFVGAGVVTLSAMIHNGEPLAKIGWFAVSVAVGVGCWAYARWGAPHTPEPVSH